MAIRTLSRAFIAPDQVSIDEVWNSLDAYRRTGALVQVPFLLTLYGETCLRRRAWDLGLAAMEEALRLATDRGEHQVTPEIYRIQARLLSGAKVEDVEPYYLRSIELARSQEARTFELRAATGLARYWSERGRRVEARDLIAPIYGWFTEGFTTPDLMDARSLLGQLS
jgi:predicted ATPase